MENNLHNSYLLQAMDAYPYNLEETLEALNYALSYNEKDVHALCLMGRVYAEQLNEYEIAKQYFAEAMTHKLETPKIYSHYVQTLLWNDDLEAAQNLLDFAMTVKGVDKALMHLLHGVLLEKQAEYKAAKKVLKAANKMATNNNFISYVKSEISRIDNKIKPKKKKRKKKKKSNKKRKEK